MEMLIASLVALALGPAVYHLLQARAGLRSFMEGFIFMAIGGIVVMGVFSEAILYFNGWMALCFVVGLLVPFALEKLFHRAASHADKLVVLIGVLGIVLHTLADGVALFADSHQGSEQYLSIGILVHRFPVSLTIWWLLKPRWNGWFAAIVLVVMGLGTVAGFSFGQGISAAFSTESIALFQAFVAGSILHVIFHRPHLDEGTVTPLARLRRMEGAGNIIGIGFTLLLLVVHPSDVAAASEHSMTEAFLGLALESAPALLLAYFIGGLLTVYLSQGPIRWLQKGGPMGQSLRGVTFGLPLPICTCGVLPLYETLIRKRVPVSAALAFLIATPEIGIDAILISVPLLGADMTVVRLVAAFIVALFVSWLIGRRYPSSHVEPEEEGHRQTKPETSNRFRSAMQHGFGELVDSTAPWILLGLLIAAMFEPYFATVNWAAFPAGTDVLLFALVGLPMYVCASGSTPIVAMLLLTGVSPGAALAFLLTGPATNAATFGMLKNLHGPALAWSFGLTTMMTAIALGLAVNWLVPGIAIRPESILEIEGTPIWQIVSLVLLGLIYASSLLRRGAYDYLHTILSLQSSSRTKADPSCSC